MTHKDKLDSTRDQVTSRLLESAPANTSLWYLITSSTGMGKTNNLKFLRVLNLPSLQSKG